MQTRKNKHKTMATTIISATRMMLLSPKTKYEAETGQQRQQKQQQLQLL